MGYESHYYLNRTLCDVLSEMRTCNKTRNYAALLSLIEEVQIMGNRMESGLDDKKDIVQMQDEKKKIWKELKELRKQKKELEGGDIISKKRYKIKVRYIKDRLDAIFVYDVKESFVHEFKEIEQYNSFIKNIDRKYIYPYTNQDSI